MVGRIGDERQGSRVVGVALAPVHPEALGAGIAAVGVGAYLWLTAPAGPSSPTALRVAPFIGRERAGVAIERAF